MAREFDPSAPLKPHTKVRSVIDLPNVPKYTDGTIDLANGVSWVRYWVRFNNGETLGHISHGDVVPVKFWDQYLVQKEQAERDAAEAEARAAAAAEAGVAAGGDGGGGDAAAGGGAVVNGVSIPPHLIERSAAARTRLGA